MDKKTDQQAPSSAPISGQLMDDLVALRAMFGGSADLTIRRMTICSHEIALVTVEGMVDRHMMADAVILPMTRMTGTAASPEALISRIRDEVLGFVDLLQVTTLDELTNLITSGFAAILTEGVPYAVLGGLQGFMMRGVSEPSTEVTVRGSREGFTEAIRINMSTVSYTHLIHGSAPDIAGQDVANPLATILSAAMLLWYSLGETDAADAIEKAVEQVLNDGLRTPDIVSEGCRKVGTAAMGDAVVRALA